MTSSVSRSFGQAMGMVPDEPVLTAWNTLLAEFGNHHRFEGYGLIELIWNVFVSNPVA